MAVCVPSSRSVRSEMWPKRKHGAPIGALYWRAAKSINMPLLRSDEN